MECPKCHHLQSKVIDSRPANDGRSIRRRRECLACQHRFNTYERIEQAPLLVIKRDGTREEFSRDKLLRGIIRSAEKRPVTHEQMNKLVLKIEEQLRQESDNEVESRRIGELVMPLLYELDEVAYIRFASVYREFQSRESFMQELEQMNQRVSESTEKLEQDQDG